MSPLMAVSVDMVVLEILAYCATCIQILHTLTSALIRPHGQRAIVVLGNCCLVCHLALIADLVAILDWQVGMPLYEVTSSGNVLAILWLNVILAGMAGVASLLLRDQYLGISAFLMLIGTPFAVNVLGAWWGVLLTVVLLILFLGSSYCLFRDLLLRHQGPTAMSIAEAMNSVDIGILLTDGQGGSVFMNEEMRSQFEKLGFPTDLGNLSDMWEKAQGYSVSLSELGITATSDMPGDMKDLDSRKDRMLVRMPDGRILLAIADHSTGSTSGVRVFTLEVTKLIELELRLAKANAALDQDNAALTEQLEDIQSIAHQAAFLRMRRAVHDVIGQRLSILQRYLDGGVMGDASLAQLESFTSSIMNELRAVSEQQITESLEDVVRAFALAGVRLEVYGSLPDNTDVSATFINVIREAATNSCRHARARTVHIELGRFRDRTTGAFLAKLRITDDGTATSDTARHEGSGIAGMRRAVEEVGGRLAISFGPPFVLTAYAPLADKVLEGTFFSLQASENDFEGF